MMDDQFKGKTILVTGGTGSIGPGVVRAVLKQQPKLVKIYARTEYAHWLKDMRRYAFRVEEALDERRESYA